MSKSGLFLLRWRADGEYLSTLFLAKDDYADWVPEREHALEFEWDQAKAVRDIWGKRFIKIVKA